MFLINQKNKFLRRLLKINHNDYNIYNKHYNFIYALLILLNGHLINVKLTNSEIVLVLKNANNLLFIFTVLNKHYKFQFKELVDICTVDYYVLDNNNRFEINYLLLSVKYKIRLRIKLYTKNNMLLSSINSVYSSALWLERENWDMFGIFFVNHPDLRRILTDYGFDGFPLRKDFPLSGYIELRYDDEKKILIYELLEMSQEFRFFEFINPWNWTVFNDVK